MPITRREALLSAAALAAASAVPQVGHSSTPSQNSDPAPQTPSASAVGPVCLTDYEPLARERISHMAWEFINGGAADEITLRWNREAYQRIRLRPRVLVDVSKLDTNIRLFGQELPYPVILAPTAFHRLVHPEGELATARGASAAGATMVLSTVATTSVEEVVAATSRPVWFQLYVQSDRGFTRDLIQRAEAAGCRALCVTVDTPLIGARNREDRVKFSLPAGMEMPNLRGLKTAASANAHRPSKGDIFSPLLSPDLTWKDLDWLRSTAKVPVLLKGVLNPEDADRAVKSGVSGLIVSNHGARNLDTVPATVDALPAVTERVAGRVPVLVDGGIRRGTDVLKALALGATAVLIGRPYLYGLGVAGAEGVESVLRILRREFEMAMALSGRPTIASIDRTVLWPDARSV
jgi:4-hydroxymandelate oxidase